MEDEKQEDKIREEIVQEAAKRKELTVRRCRIILSAAMLGPVLAVVLLCVCAHSKGDAFLCFLPSISIVLVPLLGKRLQERADSRLPVRSEPAAVTGTRAEESRGAHGNVIGHTYYIDFLLDRGVSIKFPVDRALYVTAQTLPDDGTHGTLTFQAIRFIRFETDDGIVIKPEKSTIGRPDPFAVSERR